MSKILEAKRVGIRYDRRRKLMPEDHPKLFELRAEGLSYRMIAEQFGVSKTLVMRIINPEQAEANRDRLHERGGWRLYYTKERHRLAMAGHRTYKRNLMQEKLI